MPETREGLEKREASGPVYLEPTQGRVVGIWWAWFWRWGSIFLVGSIVLNIPTMGLALALGGTQRITQAVSLLVSFLWMAGAQVYALWSLFPKTFRGFELQLESLSEGSAGNPVFVDPSLAVTMKIWWGWFWRQVVWGWPLGLVAGLITAVVLSRAGISLATIEVVAQVEGIVATAIVAMCLLPRILRKDYRGHRIRLVAMEE